MAVEREKGDRVSVEEGEKFGRWMMVGVVYPCECT